MKKIFDFIKRWWMELLFVLVMGIIILVVTDMAIDRMLDKATEKYPPKMEIGLYDHMDPITGVHYYIYNGNLYPRVCADGTYYSTYVPDIMTPVSEDLIRYEKESDQEIPSTESRVD